jgi:hypothetical protein
MLGVFSYHAALGGNFYFYSSRRGQVAQSVEQRTENPCVGGSIPPLATIFKAQPFSVGLFHIWGFPTLHGDSTSFACATGGGVLTRKRLPRRPVRPFSGLFSQKIGQNFASRARAETLS